MCGLSVYGCVCVMFTASVFCMVSKPCVQRTLGDWKRESLFSSSLFSPLYFASNLIMRSFTLYSILCRCVHLKLKCANVSIESVTPVSVSGVIWLSGGILIAQQNSDSVFRESTSTFIVSAWQAVIGESILPSKKVRLQV